MKKPYPLEDRELVVVGAGPAGMCAAQTAANCGMDVLLLEETAKCGGQLNKQIHKFFGSREHGAGKRGFEIARELEGACRSAGVEIRTKNPVIGGFSDGRLLVRGETGLYLAEPRALIVAAGAQEKPLAFPGWTLPGVMGAGAAQTLMNLYGVLPGKRVVMVGSGNVGLIVSYQLIQAGAGVAVVEIGEEAGGYRVHANRLLALGVPFLFRHEVVGAEGGDSVEAVVLRDLESGRLKRIRADCVCLAVGMSPLVELPLMLGCEMAYRGCLGGWLPQHDREMRTTQPSVWVAGDASGVEEASVAMEEGRLAAASAARDAGRIRGKRAEKLIGEIQARLCELRGGPYNWERRQAKECLGSVTRTA